MCIGRHIWKGFAKTAEILNKGRKNCKGRVNVQGLERKKVVNQRFDAHFVIMQCERFNTCASF